MQDTYLHMLTVQSAARINFKGQTCYHHEDNVGRYPNFGRTNMAETHKRTRESKQHF